MKLNIFVIGALHVRNIHIYLYERKREEKSFFEPTKTKKKSEKASSDAEKESRSSELR